jgi:hypothetical protein
MRMPADSIGLATLSGDLRGNTGRFTVKELGWFTGSDGNLAMATAARHYDTTPILYTTLANAVAASTGTSAASPDTITILKDVTMSGPADTVTIHPDTFVTLTVPPGVSRTIKRGASGFGSLVTVNAGASLALEGNGTGTLTLEGNNGAGMSASAALVSTSGDLELKPGAFIQNNDNNMSIGGGVVLSDGTFTMTGGAISGNQASGISIGMGGGVYMNGGTAIAMSGGIISGNTADTMGGGVFANGAFTMTGGTVYGAFATPLPAGLGGGTVSLAHADSAATGASLYGRVTFPNGGFVGTATKNPGQSQNPTDATLFVP